MRVEDSLKSIIIQRMSSGFHIIVMMMMDVDGVTLRMKIGMKMMTQLKQ